MKHQYDLRVVDSAIEEVEGAGLRVYYRPRQPGRRVRYRVTLRLKGKDLPYVAFATYQLHRSFRVQTHRVDRTFSNPDCALAIWTWGVFRVRVAIHLKSGQRIRVGHDLHYDQAIREADSKELQWSAVR